jgi:hypothetical protein
MDDSGYTCLRCGGCNCRPSSDDSDDGDDDDWEGRLHGWCDDCGDVRPLEE